LGSKILGVVKEQYIFQIGGIGGLGLGFVSP
jgi:hypothetical protein